jgi:hypothetical protein
MEWTPYKYVQARGHLILAFIWQFATLFYLISTAEDLRYLCIWGKEIFNIFAPESTNLSMFKNRQSRALVAHPSNPSYLRGRDQEDHGLKPAPSK